MSVSPRKINTFLFFKLPAAFWCGVRTQTIDDGCCTTTVTHRWINQNPFKSMYFAVQAMAAELSTGALVMRHINQSEHKISMLVAAHKSTYHKKATGRIVFSCRDGESIKQAIEKAVETGEGQTCWMQSTGVNGNGEIVSEMHFEWTVKAR
ncbi:DUF4442 domain-containing protein [Flavobacterium caeni]|uniref:Acyl-coenzyme A thioesterase PaaI, contains HGG motif n=1 Tax=Flavobacterium caeni TaxID=490189 RepID=A0A1G5AIG2_9FLAO|nr:DUF4442 domain-containing protein [Flavobacterium caeni]SCX77676.1 protein of unknown function [Flavobacterium caeni]